MRTFSPDVHMQTLKYKVRPIFIEHIEVADEFITSKNPD